MRLSAARHRSIGPLDLAEAARIHKEAFGWEAWDQKALGEVLQMPGAGGLMAVDAQHGDRQKLGFLLYLLVAETAELLTIAVRPGSRRAGVASGLVEHFLARAAATGAKRALLEVAEDNAAARSLYARLGFTLEGRRADYYRRPGNRHMAALLLGRPVVLPDARSPGTEPAPT
jgi:ribosomal-protein-alanine N-acetyltransferase